MSKTFSVRIIACNKVFYDGECKMLILPGADGEIGIMADHQRMTATVEEGELRFQTPDKQWRKAWVSEGLAEVEDNQVNVIVFAAENPEDVGYLKAQEEYDQAMEETLHKQSRKEYEMSQATMARALAKLKVSNRGPRIGD